MDTNIKLRAYIKLIVVIILWGSVYHVAKYLVTGTDIYTVAFIRFFISAIILLVMYYAKERRLIIYRPKYHWWLLVWIGFFGIFAYTTLFFSAESLIPANYVAVLYSFAPCATVLLSRYFLKQSIPLIAYLGIIMALIATIAVVSISDPLCAGNLICMGLVKHVSVGQILAIGAAIAMAIYNVLNRKAAQCKIDALTITTFSMVFGCILLFINFLLFGAPVASLLHKPLMFWFAMLYTAIIATALCYKWFSDAICYIGVGQVAVFLNGVPLSAVLIGIIFLGQSVKMELILAGSFIILGVIITNCSVNSYNKYRKLP